MLALRTKMAAIGKGIIGEKRAKTKQKRSIANSGLMKRMSNRTESKQKSAKKKEKRS
jgi:hypothetical protein